MQDRRRVLSYIELDDIPSSATEINSNNYTAVSGNVLYIPNNGYNGPANYSYNNSEDKSFTLTPSNSKIIIISIGDILFNNDLYLHSLNRRILLHGNSEYYYFCNQIACTHSSQSLNVLFGLHAITAPNSSSAYIPNPALIGDGNTIYYTKIKFSTEVRLGTVGSKLFTYYPPIYIDNE